MLNFTIKKNPTTHKEYLETSIAGKHLLTTPQLNKGTAFTAEERDEFGLTGKLPMHIESLEEQVNRVYLQYTSYETPLQKNIYLNKLHDTNQVLFYKLVQNHESEMLPIIYTPTVGTAVEKFSREFQQARGLYICYEQRHQIEKILDNRSNPEIDLMVVSDGGGVLGIGDQGAGAMLIPVAKLMIYTIFGGINPLRTLPILLDAGTNNAALLNDPFYLGWRHPRIAGSDYDAFIDSFVQAIKKKFPHAVLQWEDFGLENARNILHRHQDQICSFNDDIQGTGATALSALFSAIKITGIPLKDQRIVIFGGGNAGLGIADQIHRQFMQSGLCESEARAKFWVIDKAGLLIDTISNLTPQQQLYARKNEEVHTWQRNNITNTIDLLNVIQHIKPTALIGCSAKSGAFTKDAIIAMAANVERPIIFPLSNPTEKAEAVPQDLLTWTEGKALIATGSPFPTPLWQGKPYPIAQCNNALVFPGIGLGAIASQATRITDNMVSAACVALYECAPIHQDSNARLLPPMENARISAREIAIAVAKQAIQDGVATIDASNNIEACVDSHRWDAKYLPFKKVVVGSIK
jgi:malate dehydrogenase (oxaloacetate-decarboxylating)